MIKVGIIGGSGYTGGELIRLLLNHPKVEIDFVYSTTKAGKPISSAHGDLLGQTDLQFSGEVNPGVDVVFLCLGHGNSAQFLKDNDFSEITKIIDLSNDFRLQKDAGFGGRKFVYGLPELNKEKITNANAIANPGCFATTIELALLPLAKAGLLQNEVHINAITGSTGAGIKHAYEALHRGLWRREGQVLREYPDHLDCDDILLLPADKGHEFVRTAVRLVRNQVCRLRHDAAVRLFERIDQGGVVEGFVHGLSIDVSHEKSQNRRLGRAVTSGGKKARRSRTAISAARNGKASRVYSSTEQRVMAQTV